MIVGATKRQHPDNVELEEWGKPENRDRDGVDTGQGRHKRIDWNMQPLGEVSDRELARRLGCHHSAVAQARKERGDTRDIRTPFRYEARDIPPASEWPGIGDPDGGELPGVVSFFAVGWMELELLAPVKNGRRREPSDPPSRRAGEFYPPGWRTPAESRSDSFRQLRSHPAFAPRCAKGRRRPAEAVVDDMVFSAVSEWPEMEPAEVARHLVNGLEHEVLAVFGERMRRARLDTAWRRLTEKRHPHWYPLEASFRRLLTVLSDHEFLRRLERRAKQLGKTTA